MSERPKEWQDLTRREKDERRREAFKTGTRERAEGKIADGMDRDKAVREAAREQEVTSNRAWAEYQREDGHK